MTQQKILITGGAGYIGSYVNLVLCNQGYQTVVIDNLSKGSRDAVQNGTFIEGDFGDQELLNRVFTDMSISCVMHFGAFIDVGESVQNPLAYYDNNVSKTLLLLEEILKHKIKNFIFSSTAALFKTGKTSQFCETSPISPMTPYGRSKWMIEEVLKDLKVSHGLQSCALRYFNATGADPSGKIQFPLSPHNLIPTVIRSHKNALPVHIFGTDYATPDGTCIRDYIHIHDLAAAHILAMEKLAKGFCPPCFNLGNGQGFSVREVIQAAEAIIGEKILIEEGERRTGDAPKLICDSAKAKNELGWKPIYPDLKTMIEHAWCASTLVHS